MIALLIRSRRAFSIGIFAVVLGAAGAASVHAQEAAQGKAEPSNQGIWKLVNTGIFAVGLGWFLVKYSPQFFNARSSDIQKAIKDATGLKIEADFRYSDIDKKMASLPTEVNRIREQARIEGEREHERIRQQTALEIEHMQKNAANEAEALRKEAENRVQLQTAEQALARAERRLQDRFANGEPRELIDEFIRSIERGKN